MYGENRKLITLCCPVCKKWVAIRVDPEDLARHKNEGVYVQHAFVDRTGKPYLNSGEREMFLTCCPDCWALLCPDPILDPLAYS